MLFNFELDNAGDVEVSNRLPISNFLLNDDLALKVNLDINVTFFVHVDSSHLGFWSSFKEEVVA
jgi:hypothetical protein